MPQLAPKELCNGCEACANICAHGCISFQLNNTGFYYPLVNAEQCTNCGLCEKTCPILNNDSLTFRHIEYNDTIAYGAYIKNQKDIMKSASGGIAYALAQYIFKQGGVVYGVIYQNRFRDVVYTRSCTLESFQAMRGSKYVMARKYTIYKDVKKDLKSGKKVLFIGLPCEVGGLYSYLGHDYTELYTTELICAGTGSYLAHQDFLDSFEKQASSEICTFTYRHKKRGQLPCYIAVQSNHHKRYLSEFSFSALGSCIEKYKRESCYHCIYKSENRKADLTIGDFWTLNPLHPIYNHWGTSVIFPRTIKGKRLFERLDNIIKQQVNISIALRSNYGQLKTNSLPPNNRTEIENVLLAQGIEGFARHYTPLPSISHRLIGYIPGNCYKHIKKMGYWLKSKLHGIR
ncbi:Coenzyme F420 hydrogenase/dehydrogenase, beta subunit C-terminal domain [Mediterranea massiliensis]|uniref:Coenzyme F420 hydrogenase/dehydrogenase, beta subunit C-terminal domain n=1 Tax=Mediterranea massiliensis TaxID=1841865 RepID=UPI0023EFCDA2|nr:Coenzyme F420 hydrogenase/dehydrogenase, beta subunit C-terminal domain [Mediterranea massiliensis]